MALKLWILLIFGVLFTKKITKQREYKPKTNIAQTYTDIKQLANENLYLMVLFHSAPEDSAKMIAVFKRLSQMTFPKKIGFASLEATQSDRSNLQDDGIKTIPSFYLYLNGNKKHYVGNSNVENLAIWINEIFDARPVSLKSRHDIEHIDTHYFVYASKKFIKKHKKYFSSLAKLISPLRVYTGFNETEIKTHFNAGKINKKSAWIYREYGHEIKPINLSQPVESIAHEIIANEFPPFAICNEQSYRFIVDFKIPVLLYYSDKTDDQIWQAVKETAADFSDYLMPVLVRASAMDKCSTFARNFLDVRKFPGLRILNMTKGVKRFKFFGDFDSEHFLFFLHNYISGNLKGYKLNQRLPKNGMVNGVRAGNFEVFKKAINDYNHRYLFYIYDPFVPNLSWDLSVLKALQAKLIANRSFKIIVIDHFKNDIDGSYNSQLPLLFLVLRKGKFVMFESDKITKSGLLDFLKQNLSNLELTSEIDTDL